MGSVRKESREETPKKQKPITWRGGRTKITSFSKTFTAKDFPDSK